MYNVPTKSPKRRIKGSVLVALLVVLAGCDLDEFLEVRLPGEVPEEALDDPELAQTLVNSVIGDFECAWDNYVYGSAVHSDEFIPTSANLNNQEWGARQKTSFNSNYSTGGCSGGGYPFYQPLQTANFQAQDIFARLEGFEDVPNKASLLAIVRAYSGQVLVPLGEGFCEMALEGGPLLTPADVMATAEERFTEAIDLATQASESDILNMALVGRARARLNLGKYPEAIADAALVPDGYVKVATRDGSDSRRFNTHFENVILDKHASVADNYRALEWMGEPDPRVTVDTNGELGFDTATPFYFHDKVPARETPVLIASFREAQLITAEASVRLGDLDTARQIINDRHALAGIPAYDPGGSEGQDQVLAHVLEERRREFFVEGGHRLSDMLRFRGTSFEIPFLGEPGSIHPDGVTQAGLSYGPVTCWPLPEIEKITNPNIG